MTQEARYWSTLSYTEFVNEWNSSRPASQTNPGEGFQQGAGFAVGAAVITGPTPEDILWATGALCLYGLSLIAQSTTIALPMRQPYYFSRSNDDTGERDQSIPIPYPFSPDNNSTDQINIDTNSVQTFTTADPNSVVAKALIAGYMHNKRVVMTTTATLEFYAQLGTVAGTTERTAANAFLLNVQQIPDNPSARVAALRLTQSVKQNDKIIFGTGDRLGIPTISADMDFVRGALAQGIDLRTQVLTHQLFSFIGV